MKRKNEPIRAWEAGDTVQGYVLLSRKEERQDRNGRTYLDMEVTDATGSMVAKVWADSAALQADFEAHDFVAVRGQVKLYRDALQLSVDECRRVRDEDRERGFDETTLIPSTDEDIDDLWRRLTDIFPGKIERPILRRLVSETLAVHGERLRLHPAAKAIHHAYLGGLLEHVVSMAELAFRVCDHYPDIDRDTVLVGALFHDLGKLQEIGAMPANEYTLVGRLVGHTVLGRDLLLERCRAIEDFPVDLRLQLEHLILSHQGKREFAAAVEPMTAEAVVLHFIDDLDAKLNQLRNHRKQGGGLQFLRGFGRYFYLDPVAPHESGGPSETAELPSSASAGVSASAQAAAPLVEGAMERTAEGAVEESGEGSEASSSDEQSSLFAISSVESQ